MHSFKNSCRHWELDTHGAIGDLNASPYKLLFSIIFLVTLIVVIISKKYGALLILAIKIIRTIIACRSCN